MESKNDDPHGCPDTAIGECEAVCARCGRNMHPELERLREANEDILRATAKDRARLAELERRDTAAAAVEQAHQSLVGNETLMQAVLLPPWLRDPLDELVRVRREGA